jgi:hypothetical protein
MMKKIFAYIEQHPRHVLVIAGCAVCTDKMWHRLPTSVEQV